MKDKERERFIKENKHHAEKDIPEVMTWVLQGHLRRKVTGFGRSSSRLPNAEEA